MSCVKPGVHQCIGCIGNHWHSYYLVSARSGHSGNGVIIETCVLLLVVDCLICMMKDGQMGEYGGYHLPSYISHIKHSLFPKNNLLPALNIVFGVVKRS